ncbi:flagellar export chaperone FliS [Neobacillus rhizophilus]|uniref:Flagellar export chaperone FliS n=1 Tax=Neobacillus rhizophilus TaxID=2833579 RepID=A0A942U1V2_9BACI|nr:flagellar export chaperone FliS [Neobacillus rhizophilus]MBS4213040.1 flagellar export chaperone FliS [Neobacillus rhizophilus]MBU8918256.1 flagellar export chaperone FliS [Bacillus sp. FJAT-29953]
MALNNAYQSYENNQVLYAKKEELPLLLYTGAIKFILQARMAMEKKDWQRANDRIQRAQKIVTELMVTLNMDIEISKSFIVLYDYMKEKLIEANIKKEEQLLVEVEKMLIELQDTWKEALKIVRPA